MADKPTPSNDIWSKYGPSKTPLPAPTSWGTKSTGTPIKFPGFTLPFQRVFEKIPQPKSTGFVRGSGRGPLTNGVMGARTGASAGTTGTGAGQQAWWQSALNQPAQTEQPSATTGGGGAASPNANSLYVDPRSAYQPVLDYLAQQDQAVRDRYATNEANIKNIFSSLTSLTAADSARITKQFEDSLTASKANLATRTAEARQATAAGTAQAAATGAERGQGPAMAINPIQVAAEEGIARSNEYATTWQNLQDVNKTQAVADIAARGAGYGQQEISAINQLNRDLQDKLLAIGGNTAQVQADIAQAKYEQKKNIAQVKFQMAQQRAAASSKGATGLAAISGALGTQGYKDLTSGVTNAYNAAWAALNPTDATGAPISKTVKTPRAADINSAWLNSGGDVKLLPYVTKYVSSVYK